MFVFSKLFSIIMVPGNFLVILLMLGAGMLFAKGKVWQKRGRILCGAVATVCFIIAVLPIGGWALLPLENRFPEQLPRHADGIILLSGDENCEKLQSRHQSVIGESAARYIHFFAMHRKYPDAKLLYTGGSPFLVNQKECSMGKVAMSVFSDLGLQRNQVIFEEKARNTYENAKFSAQILKPHKGQKWILVTHAYHMTRSVALFRKAGFDVYPAPVGYTSKNSVWQFAKPNFKVNLSNVETAFHEYVGLISARIFGYTNQLWPEKGVP